MKKRPPFLSKKLAQIDTDAPIEITANELDYPGKDIEKLITFYKEMDFSSHLQKLDTDAYMESLGERPEEKEIQYEVVEEITSEMFADQTVIYLEMLEENYHKADIEAVAWGDDEKVYVTTIDQALESEAFKNYIEDETKHKITYDLKAYYVALKRRALELKSVDFDVVLASYLLTSEDSSSGDVADITGKHGYSSVLPDEAVYGKGVKRGIPEDKEKMAKHVASKVDGLFTIRENISKRAHRK
jgi:DNA polymerase I - 3''-5'' exonuclease and polymerase domains